jgi:hypothetical protein
MLRKSKYIDVKLMLEYFSDNKTLIYKKQDKERSFHFDIPFLKINSSMLT